MSTATTIEAAPARSRDKVPTLATLAERINTEHRACEKAMNAGLQHALECGRLLVEAKSQANHGGWLPWVKANCEFTDRTANGYMRLANRWPELESQIGNGVSDLSYREAVKLLVEPGPKPEPGDSLPSILDSIRDELVEVDWQSQTLHKATAELHLGTQEVATLQETYLELCQAEELEGVARSLKARRDKCLAKLEVIKAACEERLSELEASP